MRNVDIEIIENCIICNQRIHNKDKKFVILLGLILEYNIVYCKNCQLRWLSPRPTQEGYNKLYQYDNYFFVEDYSTIAEDRRFQYRKRIEDIEKMIPHKKTLSILDIGAATGEFSFEAKEKGHDIVGLEISSGARKKALDQFGIELIDQTLETYENKSPVDLIHMNHVFEHLLFPSQALKICHKLLSSNGVMAIEIPQQLYNDLDRLKKILFMKKKVKFTPYSIHHTFFYTPHSIRKLFEKHGFRVEILRTANKNRTPLKPLSLHNLFLRIFLFLSDKIHHGGNIIEIYARKV